MGAMVLSAPIAWAQQQEPDQSAQPRSPLSRFRHTIRRSLPQRITGTKRPSRFSETSSRYTALTGVQDLSLGVPPTNHSYWQPHLDLSSTVDSNPLTGQGINWWTTFTSIFGGIDMHRNSGNSMMTLRLYRRRIIFERRQSEQRSHTRAEFFRTAVLSPLCASPSSINLCMLRRLRLGQPELQTARHCRAVERWVSETDTRRDRQY